MKKVVISEYNNKIMFALFEEEVLTELYFFKKDEIPLETVLLCRVCNRLPNIDACFIRYAKDKTGFLKSTAYRQEAIIPLQYKKEVSGNKEPVFTDKISLSSTYCVVQGNDRGLKISSKIDEELSHKLKEHFKGLAASLNVFVIIRTNAAFASFEEIEEDMVKTASKLKKIYELASCRTLYSVLHKTESEYLKAIKNINLSEPLSIVTDIASIYDEISQEFYDNTQIEVKLYKDELLPLNKLYGMESKIKEALSRIIYLPSGAQIIIDRTEALVAIDVNTYHTKFKGDKEDTFYETNIEAAHEVMRQIKLKNLSGMIIVDFINMKLDKHYEMLIKCLEALAKQDTSAVSVIDLTALKLVEIVREKKHKSLYEQLR